MLKWLHHILNPHCPHCIDEAKEKSVCNGCEILKLENARLVQVNRDLLNRLLNPITPTIPTGVEQEQPVPINKFKSHIPWTMKRQLLENEDRHRASLLKEANKQSTKEEIEELEKELDLATEKREAGSN